MSETTYPIDTSADEFTRLKIQADLFRDDARAMLARIGDGVGRRVLDLCCGTGGITDVLSDWVGEHGEVVGADLDAAKLDEARTWATSLGLDNVAFVEADAFASGLPAHSFDLVHTRFAISTIKDGIGILDHMLTLVRPNGIVFVQEVNTHTMQCEPTTPDWEDALALMKRAFRAVGADTEIGLSLRRTFLERGLGDVVVRPCLDAQTSNDPMTMHLPLTLASMAEAISALGLMPTAEIHALAKRVADHLAKPDTTTISFSMIQVVGRAPG